MKIKATQTFLDDRDRFEEGTEYEVDDVRGGYFVAHGWAATEDGYVGPGTNQNVTLEIHDAVHADTGKG